MSGSKSSEERQMTPKQAVLKAAEICEANKREQLRYPAGDWSNGPDTAEECAEEIRAFAETLEGEPEGLLRSLSLRCGYIISGYGDAKLEAKEMLRLITAAMPPTPKERPEGKLLVAAPSREGKP